MVSDIGIVYEFWVTSLGSSVQGLLRDVTVGIRATGLAGSLYCGL